MFLSWRKHSKYGKETTVNKNTTKHLVNYEDLFYSWENFTLKKNPIWLKSFTYWLHSEVLLPSQTHDSTYFAIIYWLVGKEGIVSQVYNSVKKHNCFITLPPQSIYIRISTVEFYL